MASLKSLLQAAMLKVGSASGQASTDVITVVSSFTAEGSFAQGAYIAPSDGILYARAGASTGRGYVQVGNGVSVSTDAEQVMSQSNTDSDSARACIPVKKGRTASYQFIARTGVLKFCVLYFVKSVGGVSVFSKLFGKAEVSYAFA